MLNMDSKPELKRSLYSVSLSDGTLVFVCTPDRPVVLQKISGFQRSLIALLDGTKTIKDIIRILNEMISCTEQEILDELNRLGDRLLIEEPAEEENSTLNEDYMSRYLRQHLYFAAKKSDGNAYALEVHNILQNTHIVLFGLGSIGSIVLYQLAALGIQKITAVDFDVVEEKNLTNQCLYFESDIGRPKIEAAKERCRAINSAADYRFINKKILSDSDFADIMADSDLAVLAAETPREGIFKWMNRASYQTKIPCLFTLGVSHSNVMIGPLVVPGKTVCFECSMPPETIFNRKDPLVEFINSRNLQGTIMPDNMVATGIMVLEILKHLVHFDDCRLYNHRLHLNTRTYELSFQKFEGRKDCKYCGNLIS